MRARMLMKFFVYLILTASACVTSLYAQLPEIEKKPWLGYFVSYTGRDCLFGVSTQGDIDLQLEPAKRKDNEEKGIGNTAMSILVGVEEEKSNTKPIFKKILPHTLQTKDTSTNKLEKTVISGKVSGEASFELTIEQEHGIFTISNRLIDAGNLTKNKIRPVVVLRMPLLYRYANENEISRAKTRERDRDTLNLKWTNGNKKKFSLRDELDANTEEVNGPGISMAQIDAGGLMRERKITLEAPQGVSVIRASNSSRQMLNRGMSFISMPAPAKPDEKPKDTARLVINVR